MSVEADGKTSKPLPSLREIRQAIPPHCFEKSVWRSLYYVLHDYAILAALYYFYETFAGYGMAGLLVWWNLVGIFMFALFVIGHDCGHGSFSDYTWMNDLVGHVCLATIFVPHWPLKKSHRLHHTYTSHLTKDTGHTWFKRADYEKLHSIVQWFNEVPFAAFISWFPTYTVFGILDGSHFWPFSSLFSTQKERAQCIVSTITCMTSAWLIYRFVCGDLRAFMLMYLVPLLFCGALLTIVTFLSHHDEDVKVYDDGIWTFMKGTFQTTDRPYGFAMDYLMHHINDCHVAHHLFPSQIAHYHLPEATKAVRAFLQPYGIYKRRNSYDYIMEYTRLNFRLKCLDGEGVLYYAENSDKKTKLE